MNNIAIVQARMGSSRMPGKAMADLAGEPCIYHVVNRLKKADIDSVVIATPENNNNQALWKYLIDIRVPFFVGDEEDVLKRVTECVRMYHADNIIDVTADCPLIDTTMVSEMLKSHITTGADLTTNVVPRCWPDGFDCQIYKREILETVNKIVKNPTHRKHTGWNIMNSLPMVEKDLERNLVITSYRPDNEYWLPDMRLTLDTEEDAKTIDHILKTLGHDCGWKQIIDYVQNHPEFMYNKEIQPKVPGEG